MDLKRKIHGRGTSNISSEEQGTVPTSSFEPCNIDIRLDGPLVLDQKSEGCCLPIAITDVTEIILKRSGDIPQDLPLSPQTLVDSRIYKDMYDVDELLGDSDFGLESVYTTPFVRMERPAKDWDLGRYKRRPYPKHFISGISEIQREDLFDIPHSVNNFCEEGRIVEALKENFREGGNNFPLVGTMKMGSFARRDVSAKFARDLDGLPFHHPPAPKKPRRKKAKSVKEIYHAVVVMGLNTMSPDSRFHYCWVKSSYGRKWGVNGFSRVGLDVFVSLATPSYDQKAWAKLKESENVGVVAYDGPETQPENKAMEADIKNLVCILDGKSLANEVRNEVTTEIVRMKSEIRTVPGLAIIQVGDINDSKTHVYNKRLACEYVGIKCKVVTLPEDCTEAEVLQHISKFNSNLSFHGILVELPLPSHINERTVLNALSINKDVGGFHSQNMDYLGIGKELFFAPWAKACIELLHGYEIPIKDKRVVVISRSDAGGMPIAFLLQREGAEVTIVHSETVNPEEITRSADIIISAVGKPDLVRGSWVKPGAILVDAGASKVEVTDLEEDSEEDLEEDSEEDSEGSKQVVGDICFKEANEVASAITSVPGGVGPMTIVMLLSNTLLAAKRIHKFE